MANKYTVIAEMITRLQVEVVAESEEEALKKAKSIDGGDFTEIEGGSDWHIEGASLIEENVAYEDDEAVAFMLDLLKSISPAVDNKPIQF